MKAPTQLRTETWIPPKDMKLSVLNCSPRQGRLSSLSSTNEAKKNLYYQKYEIHTKGSGGAIVNLNKKTAPAAIDMNLVYTINQGGK
jgi:hypothetical protein